MSYLLPLLKKQEFSKRALELTGEILSQNASHYSVWYVDLIRKYRHDIIKHINPSLDEELDFITSLAHEHPKSFQIWYLLLMRHHRAQLPLVADQEFEFVDLMLENDAKNYHAWSYRYR
jgi:protein farnesyltransferase/geranylgeranyltransferase type-1 subunit alpha